MNVKIVSFLRMRLRRFQVYKVLKVGTLNAWRVAVVIVSRSFIPYSIFRHEAFRSVFGVGFHDLYIECRVNIWGPGAVLICFDYLVGLLRLLFFGQKKVFWSV